MNAVFSSQKLPYVCQLFLFTALTSSVQFNSSTSESTAVHGYIAISSQV